MFCLGDWYNFGLHTTNVSLLTILMSPSPHSSTCYFGKVLLCRYKLMFSTLSILKRLKLKVSALVDAMGDKEHDSHKHGCDCKNKQEAFQLIDISTFNHIIDEEIYHYHDSYQQNRQLRQHDNDQSPQRAPPVVTEELVVGDVPIGHAKHEFDSSAPVAKKLKRRIRTLRDTCRKNPSGSVWRG